MNQEKIRALEQTIARDYGGVVGMVVEQGRVPRYEGYFHGFSNQDAAHVFSVTKSIFSALVGIAIDQGHIKGVAQKVLDFFPDYTPAPGETAAQDVTIAHLLTMTAPYKCEVEPFAAFFASENWVDFALGLLGGAAPRGEFRYSPLVGTHILSGILARATGRPILDFAREYLFAPLGIRVTAPVVLDSEEAQMAFYAQAKHTGGWVVDPQGLNTASWGLTLTPMDMAKIGRLYLGGGRWDGRQMVPAEWIAESTAVHSRWGELSYGYLWWLVDEREQSYAAMGDGGTVIYVNPAKQLVVAIAALFTPDAKDSIELIRGELEPLFAP